jgi:hypothetical protein
MIVLGVSAFGCSSDKGPPAVGRQFRARAVVVCRKALALKKAEGPFPYPNFNPTKPDPSKLRGVADFLEKTQSTFETWLRDMRNLGSPPSGQAAWADLVAAVQRHVELNGEQIVAARQGDLKTFSDDYVKGTEVQDQSLKAASDAGVPECSAVDH